MTIDAQPARAGVGHDELVRRAQALAPGIRARSAETEAGRRVPQASIDEIVGAGLIRTLTPARYGGDELWFDAWFDVTVEIGKACASTAWCASLLTHINHLLALFPQEAQEAVWADGPDVCLVHAIPPIAKVEKVDGGYRLTGEHPFASGIDHAQWAIVGGLIHDGDSHDFSQFLISPGDFEIRDTWFAAGMRGTGSKTAVIDGAFVPEAHRVSMHAVIDGHTPGGRLHPGKLYQLPFVMFGGPTFLAPMLGAGRGLYDLFVTEMRDRRDRMVQVADRWSVQETVSRAAVDLDLAELLIRRVMAVARDTEPGPIERAQTLRDYTRASELIRDAVDRLVRHTGTRAFFDSNPAQKTWRDVNVIASHVAFNPEYNLSYFGRLELGLERDPTMALF
ncbi:MAG TPA: acyl-CoA dehydrogenase family protein [Solirubrobacteraceae bacterium]|nr:acyl-CoA dehydrogenase family protein [Solirubrobacteraceae bacterium]